MQTVIFTGRFDGSPTSALTVTAGGHTRRMPLGIETDVPNAVAERCRELELESAYTFNFGETSDDAPDPQNTTDSGAGDAGADD